MTVADVICQHFRLIEVQQKSQGITIRVIGPFRQVRTQASPGGL